MSFRSLQIQCFFIFSTMLFSLNSLESGPLPAASNLFNFSRNTDRQALMSIKDQLQSDPSEFLAQWNYSLHFCNWKGVTCNMAHQRVVALDLPNLQLAGPLSPYIGNLTTLKKLNLENNLFYGRIPQEIGRLYQLEYISLNDNLFQGEIPINLTHCSDIRVIGLGRNNLEGKVPAVLSSLSNLQQLNLSRNHLNGFLPTSLGNLSSLKVLSLSDNKLEGGIPPEFGKLSNLGFLGLSSNKLSGAVPILLFNMSSIRYFELASNLLNGSFPEDLGLYFPKLETFYVAENQFSGPIPATITNASSLSFLDTGSNSFCGPLPMYIGLLKQLERLDFSGNPVVSNGKSGLNFLISLTNCTRLRVLHLNANNHKGVLPSSMANISNQLISLRLDGNFFSGGIPEWVGKLTKLQGLYLSRNKFSGEIPSSIGNFSQLSILEMQENMLVGAIPASLSNCNGLQKLDLSQNTLTGAIPYGLLGLKSLISLSLAENQLTGLLPFMVGNLANLVSMDISYNNLSGELPHTLGSCIGVEFLSVRANYFNGSIPQSFEGLKNIQILDLSSNSLSGMIPTSLTKSLSIQYLNLSFNNLEGEVPNEGLFRNLSAFSITGNQKLCGGMKLLELQECLKENQSRRSKVSSSTQKPTQPVSVLITVCLIFLAALCLSILLWPRKTRTARAGRAVRTARAEVSFGSPLGDHYPRLSYTELMQATNSFSPANLIAMGRYSSVYKGILNYSGQTVAVKVLNLQNSGATKSFQAECEALRNTRHRNLVKIITSFSGSDLRGDEFKALVFKFMPNGNLESWLHPVSHNSLNRNLSFIQRLHIAIDVASAIDYLHHCCEIRFIHRDIKPNNIFLDDELCAHLGDFGSARSLLLPLDKSSHVRIRSSAIGIIGTVGYVAIECGFGGRVSTLVDVYSYGILLLEMFTGKRPTDSIFRDNFTLHNYVKMAIPDKL